MAWNALRKKLKLLGIIFLASSLSTPAFAQAKTKAALTTEITTLFPDNTVGAITPAKLRTVTQDIVNSYTGLIDANSLTLQNIFAGPILVPSTVTGGSQGAGTINAAGLFVNGVAVTTTAGGAGTLSRTSDTNVTMTLGGTPVGALFNSVSMTLGWSGTLAQSRGGWGSDISASSGVPLFAAGVPTFTSTTGTGNFVRASTPTVANPTFTGSFTATGLVTNAALANPATTVNGQTCTLGSTCTIVTGSLVLPITVSGTVNSGGVPYFNSAVQMSSSAALAANALMIGGGAGVAPSTTTTGAGILTWLGTPSSANLAAAVTDETGSGALVFGTSPSITTPSVTTPTFLTSALFNGSGSGVITLKTQAAAGTWEWDWPTTAGTAGQVLTSQGGSGSAMTWTTVAGTGTVTNIATGAGLTGGPITTTGTIATTGVLADLAGITWAQGDVIYYNGTHLINLPAGSSGQLLKTNGAGANPSWATVAGSGTVTSVSAGTGMNFTTITGSGSVAIDGATAANFQAATANKVLTADVVFTAESTTTFGTTTTFDFSTFINTQVTLTGNITTQSVSNVKAGQAGTISFLQDGTGSRTTVWNSAFKFAGGTTPTLTTTANARDVLTYACRTATFCTANLLKDVK